jgi:hypothetical protein
VENNLIRLPFSERGFESGEVGAARMVGVAGNAGGTVGGEMYVRRWLSRRDDFA